MTGTLTVDALKRAWSLIGRTQPKRYLIGRSFELTCLAQLLEVMPGTPLANQFIWKESSFAPQGKVFMMVMHGALFSVDNGDCIYVLDNVTQFTNPAVIEAIKAEFKR